MILDLSSLPGRKSKVIGPAPPRVWNLWRQSPRHPVKSRLSSCARSGGKVIVLNGRPTRPGLRWLTRGTRTVQSRIGGLSRCGRPAVMVAVVLLVASCASSRTAPGAPRSSAPHLTSTQASSSASSTSAPSRVAPPPYTADTTRKAPRSSMVSTPPTSGRIPDPSTGAAVQVGLSDNGRQVELRRGQRLRVELAGTWAAPVAGPTGEGAGLQVLHRDSAHGSSAQGPAVATFTAVRVGLASVLATEDVPCLHTQPRCARPQGHFELTVLVIPPPGMSAGPLPVPAP